MLLMPRVTQMMYNLTKQTGCAGSLDTVLSTVRAGNYGRGACRGTGFRQIVITKQPGNLVVNTLRRLGIRDDGTWKIV